MDISEFIGGYSNHPILFIGSGLSFRYLNNTYTWNNLLLKVSEELWGNDEKYLDIKSSCPSSNGDFNYARIASKLEKEFNDALSKDRDGKFKEINDIFYDRMRHGENVSRFKIYIAKLFESLNLKSEMSNEISELKKVRKNIGSIITTNYDQLIETIFEFNPLIGNDILLSNPYGSVYKIHGCVTDISKIIITEEDYQKFDSQYELIRAQMLSLFIHNPIIFLGYSIGDDNIKKVLKTIFSYIPPNTEQADKVRNNFLLVEYDKGSSNREVTEHDIIIDNSSIRINRLKTDDFLSLYKPLADINLPVSAMDIRKVQSVVKEIYSGGSIKVSITEDIDNLRNSDRILAIGSSKTIRIQFLTIKEMIQTYFTIIDESNSAVLTLINKQTISESQYFPVFGFSRICSEIDNVDNLKRQQTNNVKQYLSKKEHSNTHHTVDEIMGDDEIRRTYKYDAIMYSLNNNNLTLNDVENFLRNQTKEQKKASEYRRLLCLFDMKKYSD